jgi:hypothetical protein
MASPRYHIPLGARTPDRRRERTSLLRDLAAWRALLCEVVEGRLARRLGHAPVGLDGRVLVPGRTEQHGSREVRVEDGVAVACSCSARRGAPCLHRMVVAVWLWEHTHGTDIAAVALGALLPQLVAAYLTPPADRRRTGPGSAADGLPEVRSA